MPTHETTLRLAMTLCILVGIANSLAALQAVQVDRGVIRGSIFDRNTNKPIEGTLLRLVRVDGRRDVLRATTDTAGAYRFANLPMGSYTFSLARLGYHPLELDVLVNRTAPLVVSIGLTPAPVSLPEVSVEAEPPTYTAGTRGTPSIINRRNTVEASEITERGLDGQDLYVVLRRLRPDWLNTRSEARFVGSPSRVVLYVNNIRRGSIEDLRSIDADMVARIHFFDALQATQEWGTGHVNGAINVHLKPPGR